MRALDVPPPPAPPAAEHLYVHLPFCASRCGYCAFVVEVGSLDRRDAYLDALLAELRRESGHLAPLRSVYLGGGTPTLMRGPRLGRLLDAIRPCLAPGAEVSVEANPETLAAGILSELRHAGVTRLSLGVQSFQPHLLAALDRQASPDQARRAFACARAQGFADISIDLLFGVPGQTPADLEADLAEALALEPDHVSWYELELKPGSALARAGTAAYDEDDAANAYRRVVAGLEGAGYRWYETANFARPGHECRHSLAYWGAADYLGIGVGAVSTLGGLRRRNAPGLARYLAALAAGADPPRSQEALSADTRRRERWMLALRLDRPLDMAWAGPPDRPEAIAHLRAAGMVLGGDGDGGDGDDELTLTREGRFLQNSVLHELVEFG